MFTDEISMVVFISLPIRMGATLKYVYIHPYVEFI